MENDAKHLHNSENEQERLPVELIRMEPKRGSFHGSNGQVCSLPTAVQAGEHEEELKAMCKSSYLKPVLIKIQCYVSVINGHIRKY